MSERNAPARSSEGATAKCVGLATTQPKISCEERPAGRRGSFSFEPLAGGSGERYFELFGNLHKNRSKTLCNLRIDILPILWYNNITVKGNERLSFPVKRETTREPHRPSEWCCLKRKRWKNFWKPLDKIHNLWYNIITKKKKGIHNNVRNHQKSNPNAQQLLHR